MTTSQSDDSDLQRNGSVQSPTQSTVFDSVVRDPEKGPPQGIAAAETKAQTDASPAQDPLLVSGIPYLYKIITLVPCSCLGILHV